MCTRSTLKLRKATAMGTLAESVKAAEAKVAAEPGMFEDPAPPLQGRRGELHQNFADILQR